MAEKPNIQVSVRIRPFNSLEKAQNATECCFVNNKEVRLVDPTTQMENRFAFDHCYPSETMQQEVYESMGEPMLEKVFSGFNCTIFAYGQTGSGKSHSMTGSVDNPGITPRLTKGLFERITKEKSVNPKIKFLVTCSYLEIYNEMLFDLLVPNRKAQGVKGLEVKEHAVLGVYVQNLQDVVVEDADKIEKLMQQGLASRQTAATNMNEHSSRSHSIFSIKVRQKEEGEGGRSLFANINLVDLAGSERQSKTGAAGDRLKEASSINKSLSALGNVINALAEDSNPDKKKKGKVFIPYRNSKLTRVLQDSLGGNSLTIMLAAISKASYNFDETLSTLRFADRAKQIKLKPTANEEASLVAQLNREIEMLKKKLAEGGSVKSDGMTDEERENMALQMQTQLAEMNAIQQQSWEEKERISKQFEEERQQMLLKTEEERKMLSKKYEEQKRQILESRDDLTFLLQGVTKADPASAERLNALYNEIRQIRKDLIDSRTSAAAMRGVLGEQLAQHVQMQKVGGGVGGVEKLLIDQVRNKLQGLMNQETALKGMHDKVYALLDGFQEDITKLSHRFKEEAESSALPDDLDLVLKQVQLQRQKVAEEHTHVGHAHSAVYVELLKWTVPLQKKWLETASSETQEASVKLLKKLAKYNTDVEAVRESMGSAVPTPEQALEWLPLCLKSVEVVSRLLASGSHSSAAGGASHEVQALQAQGERLRQELAAAKATETEMTKQFEGTANERNVLLAKLKKERQRLKREKEITATLQNEIIRLTGEPLALPEPEEEPERDKSKSKKSRRPKTGEEDDTPSSAGESRRQKGDDDDAMFSVANDGGEEGALLEDKPKRKHKKAAPLPEYKEVSISGSEPQEELLAKVAELKSQNKSMHSALQNVDKEREEVSMLMEQLNVNMNDLRRKAEASEAVSRERDHLQQELAAVADIRERFEEMLAENLKLREERTLLEAKMSMGMADGAAGDVAMHVQGELAELQQKMEEMQMQENEFVQQIATLEEDLENERQYSKEYYEKYNDIQDQHERVAEGYIDLSERYAAKLDELSEMEEQRQMEKEKHEKMYADYLELMRSTKELRAQ